MQCENCHLDFESTVRTRRFCSSRCRRRAEKRRWKHRQVERNQALRLLKTGLLPGESRCKICDVKFKRIYNNAVYCSSECRSKGYQQGQQNAAKARKAFQEMRRRNCLECSLEFKPRGPQKVCSSKCAKSRASRRSRLRTYNLTEETFSQMVKQLDNCCQICGDKTALNIDHCHDTGKVRGLLCRSCNAGLGLFKDNISSLMAAIKYLEADGIS